MEQKMEQATDQRNSQIRASAYDAEAGGNFAEAAELYQMVIDRYPAGTGAMRARDIELLQQRVAYLRSAEQVLA